MSIKDFHMISLLGNGSYSSVWKVKRLSDGKEYAMKKVELASLSEKEKDNALNEIRILASINDPNIIGYKESFIEDDTMSLCIVMEYAGGGDISNKISQHKKNGTCFSEEDIWRMFIQMVKALKTLHDLKILHRDLKPANIFTSTDGKSVKLGDLNVSKVIKDNLAYTQTGTPYYASPEVWRHQPYDAKSDIWSLGCVIYEIASLKPPFMANNLEGLYKKVQSGFFAPIPSHYSIDLHNIICQCLQVCPALRPNCDNLLNNPMVIHRIERIASCGSHSLDESRGGELLKTIKMPKNLKSLSEHLPKANYNYDGLLNLNIVKIKEKERLDINAKYGKRAISQQTLLEKNTEIKSCKSRESIIHQFNKTPEKESDAEYLLRMQREYIDRARVITNISSINSIENIPSRNKSVTNTNSNYGNDTSIKVSIQSNHGLLSNNSNLIHDHISTSQEKPSNQINLILKYQNRANELNNYLRKEQAGYFSIKKNNINQKADFLIQKYKSKPQKTSDKVLLPSILNDNLKLGSPRNTIQNKYLKDLTTKQSNVYSNSKGKYENISQYTRNSTGTNIKQSNVLIGHAIQNCSNKEVHENGYNHLKGSSSQQKVIKPA